MCFPTDMSEESRSDAPVISMIAQQQVPMPVFATHIYLLTTIITLA